MTNGYIVLTKGEPNLYKHAIEAITLGKPIYYADGNKVAFVNSIELVSTDVVIKTSDKQITVASDGTETEVEKGLYMGVYEFEFIDANEDTITLASFKLFSDNRETLQSISGADKLYSYLNDNGYNESSKGYDISAGDYISMYAGSPNTIVLMKTDNTTVSASLQSNYDNAVILKIA